jgi:signal transduction histidine kinase
MPAGRAVGAVRRRFDGRDWTLPAGVLLGLLAVVEIVLRGDHAGADLPVVVLLGQFCTVPLIVVRTHVVTVAATVTVAALLCVLIIQWLPGAAVAAQVIAGYLLGRRASRPAAAAVAVPFLAFLVIAALSTNGPAADAAALDPGDRLLGSPGSVALLAVLTATAVGFGWLRRAHGEAAARDASRRAVADSLLEHAARGERARIARELHDVVAHHISMIAVQAETARLTTPGMPADGAKRLLAIGDTARTALTEMRRLLGVLREDAQTEPTRLPQPGLRQLNDLIDEARQSGGRTRLLVRGQVVPLGQGVELTAFRIVQEALTNARRHAPGAAVDVELHYADDALRIRVRDNGPGPSTNGSGPAGGGHGLLGMRERAASLGGTIRIGPAPICGLLVEATLPTPRAGR